MNTIQYKNHTIKLVVDEDPINPRDEWTNFGTLVCFHRRYNLGDKHDLDIDYAKELEKSDDVISLPVYLYDHSGLTISTKPFPCPWDSGKIGFIYIGKDKIKSEGVSEEQALKNLQSEIEVYDAFLRGDVYGYQTSNAEGEEIDSCYGFYKLVDAVCAAKSEIDAINTTTK